MKFRSWSSKCGKEAYGKFFSNFLMDYPFRSIRISGHDDFDGYGARVANVNITYCQVFGLPRGLFVNLAARRSTSSIVESIKNDFTR